MVFSCDCTVRNQMNFVHQCALTVRTGILIHGQTFSAMKKYLDVRSWARLSLFAVLLAVGLRAAEAGDRPIQLTEKYETVIPVPLQSLLLDNPTVRYFVTVNEEGKLVDYLALDAMHFGLLDRADVILKQAVFSPALAAAKAVQASGEVTLYFFDPEQRALRSGLITRPFGLSQTDATSRRVYETSKDRFVYRRAEPAELDQPITELETKIMVLTDANGQTASGACVVDFYIDRRGEVRAPRMVSSDNETVALSALLTLQHTRYAPISRAKGTPAYVKVRLPMSFAPVVAAKPAETK